MKFRKMEKEYSITKNLNVKPCHDRVGVEFELPDDYLILDLAEAKEVVKLLSSSIEIAESNKPLAPEPVDLSRDFDTSNSKEFACTSECRESIDCWIEVGGYELSISSAKKVHEFLGKALAYHEKGKGNHDN